MTDPVVAKTRPDRGKLLDQALDMLEQASKLGKTQPWPNEFSALLFDTLRLVCSYLEEVEIEREEIQKMTATFEPIQSGEKL